MLNLSSHRSQSCNWSPSSLIAREFFFDSLDIKHLFFSLAAAVGTYGYKNKSPVSGNWATDVCMELCFHTSYAVRGDTESKALVQLAPSCLHTVDHRSFYWMYWAEISRGAWNRFAKPHSSHNFKDTFYDLHTSFYLPQLCPRAVCRSTLFIYPSSCSSAPSSS